MRQSISLQESIDTVLTIHQSDLINTEVVKKYDEVSNIEGDPDRISQIWINLISNALYASKKKGGKEKLEIGLEQKEEYVIVTIKDYAGGIPKEVKEKIFEPFFTTKPQGDGTGLGLSIIKKIVDDHDGQISLETKENVSTKMIVKFKSS